MKSRDFVPNATERFIAAGSYIISTTDLKGRITSVNDTLVDLSGFSRAELIGTHHNILRHPDMPRAVFAMAWATITGGEDFSGYIKNLCKDGSFYWVFAHIVVQTDAEGELAGFRSVRRAASRTAVSTIEPVYVAMCAAEQAAGARDAMTAGSEVLCAFLRQRGQSYAQMVATL